MRVPVVFTQMMSMGIVACPIIIVLSFAIGVMLGIQMIYNLRTFSAGSQVVVGVALSVTREFGPLNYRNTHRGPLLLKGYQAIGKMDDESMQSAVKAFDSALSEIFSEFYTDMSSALN